MKTAEEMITAPTRQQFREIEDAAAAACQAEVATWSALTNDPPADVVDVGAVTKAAGDAVARVADAARRFQTAARLRWIRASDLEADERIVVSADLADVGVIGPVAAGVAYRELWVVDGVDEGDWRLQRRGLLIAYHDPQVGTCWKWRGRVWLEAA